MKKNIRKVIRSRLPETNSSSSHSVCITSDSVYVEPKNIIYPHTSDGKIYIPTVGVSFDWEWEKYNTVLEKTQYTIGLILNQLPWDFNFLEFRKIKKLSKLKQMILDFTGESGIRFGWEDWMDSEKAKDTMGRIEMGVTIDHESNLSKEILDNYKTMKDFIFNPKSWLFLGNDNSNCPKDFYKEKDLSSVNAIVSAQFPKPYGTIDFELTNFPCNFSVGISDLDIDILESIKLGTNLLRYSSVLSYNCIEEGENYIIFVKNSINSEYMSSLAENVIDVIDFLKSEYNIGEDYFLIPFQIKSNEFGLL